MATQVLQCGGVVTYQLLSGREVAKDNQAAAQMANYMYLIVNTLDHTAIAVDAAWDIDGLYGLADQLGVRIRGAVYTHAHFDHCGGQVPTMFTGGRPVAPLQGAKEVERRGGEIWAGSGDAEAIRAQCGLDAITSLEDGSCLECGDLVLHAISTPGHTVGSICVFATPQCLSPRGSLRAELAGETLSKAERGLLITGDTLFPGSCGRVDLPGGNGAEMLRSLSRLDALHPEVVVLPGHDYAPVPFSTIGTERASNGIVREGLLQVPSPPPLPPCCAGDAFGMCGPRGFIIGRKVRITDRAAKQRARAAAEAAKAKAAGAAAGGVGGQNEEDAGDGFGIVQRFDEQSGEYTVGLLPGGGLAVVRIAPEHLAASSHKPAL